jgi:hypothetical protein
LPWAVASSLPDTDAGTCPAVARAARGRRRARAADAQQRQAGLPRVEGLADAQAEQHDDALGGEAVRGELQRLQRRGVEPVDVVDDDEHRLLLGRRGEHAEHRRGDGEAVGRRGRPDGQRAAQGGGLRLGDAVEQVEDRREEVEQRGERDVGLRLVAAGAQDAEVGRRGDRLGQQRALADARLAVDDEGGRAAFARAFEDGLELAAFPGAPDHRRPRVDAS